MILNTGSRTDIPAFYSDWFYNRVREGFVMARNPYRPDQILRYRLDPDVVDVLVFCTKNPAPMLPRTEELDAFRQFWHVTITAYGTDIEPGVPPVSEVCESFRRLASSPGRRTVGWRYDPIFTDKKHTVDEHIRAFGRIAAELEGYTQQVVISFIDLYARTKQNFPEVREVSGSDRRLLGAALSEIARSRGMRIFTCLEGRDMAEFGIDTGGCMTAEVLESAIGEELKVPSGTAPARKGCRCLLGNDIGVYNTCRHFCRYCYANYDRESVIRNSSMHDPESPLMIGRLQPGDTVIEARQESWLTGQMRLF